MNLGQQNRDQYLIVEGKLNDVITTHKIKIDDITTHRIRIDDITNHKIRIDDIS